MNKLLDTIHEFFYWIRSHLWNKYHIIDISGEADYSYGWIDADHALLLANFKILRDFVEKEDPKVGLRTLKSYGKADYDSSWNKTVKAQLEKEKEIRALYVWWTKTRPKEHKDLGKMLDSYDDSLLIFNKSTKNNSMKWFNKNKELDAKDEEMLIRLIKVRGKMWT